MISIRVKILKKDRISRLQMDIFICFIVLVNEKFAEKKVLGLEKNYLVRVKSGKSQRILLLAGYGNPVIGVSKKFHCLMLSQPCK